MKRTNKSSSAGTHPKPSEIAAARAAAKLTQTEAAEKIFSTLRTWQDWESGARRMHPAMWELFLIKTGQVDPATWC